MVNKNLVHRIKPKYGKKIFNALRMYVIKSDYLIRCYDIEGR